MKTRSRASIIQIVQAGLSRARVRDAARRLRASLRSTVCVALCAGVALGTAAPSPVLAAEVVGDVVLVREWAYETPPGGTREPIFVRDDVLFGALLETVRNGALHVRLIDDSEIRLGPDAKLEVDALVFDPATGEETLSLEIAAGPMRFISGRIRAERIKIESAVAEVGIRGTDLFALAAVSGEFYLHVLAGIAALTAKVSRVAETLSAGEAAVVSADGRTITRVSSRPVPDHLQGTPGDTGFPLTDPEGSEGADKDEGGGGGGDDSGEGGGDAGTGDSGSGDTGSSGTDSGDTGSGDTGSGDTGSGDTGSGDTGSGDTGAGDTGSGDTGSGATDAGDTGGGGGGTDSPG